jgi:hypothetical protein
MDVRTREEALLCLRNEFQVQNRNFLKNEWIKGGRIPEIYQERTVELFQNLLRKQGVRSL